MPCISLWLFVDFCLFCTSIQWWPMLLLSIDLDLNVGLYGIIIIIIILFAVQIHQQKHSQQTAPSCLVKIGCSCPVHPKHVNDRTLSFFCLPALFTCLRPLQWLLQIHVNSITREIPTSLLISHGYFFSLSITNSLHSKFIVMHGSQIVCWFNSCSAPTDA